MAATSLNGDSTVGNEEAFKVSAEELGKAIMAAAGLEPGEAKRR